MTLRKFVFRVRCFVFGWHRAWSRESIGRDGSRLLEFAQRKDRKSSATRKNKRQRRRRRRERDGNCIFMQREREKNRERGRELLSEIYFGTRQTHRAIRENARENRIMTRACARNIKNIRGEANVRCAERKNKAERAEGLYRRCDEIWMVKPAERSRDDLMRRIDLSNLVPSE